MLVLLKIIAKQQKMNKIVKNITIGIKHQRTFKIKDNFGRFIDCILHDASSPFGVKFFPFVDEKFSDSVTLHNPKGEYFQIDSDDFVLVVKNKDEFEKNILNLKNDTFPFIRKKLFNVTKINDIIRVGIIFSLEIKSKKEINKIISYLTNDSIETINSLDMKFSHKKIIGESLTKSAVNDYINVIYSLVKKKDKMLVNVDYQRHFDPFLTDINDFNANRFIDSAVNNLKNSYNEWLKDYEAKSRKDKTEKSSKKGGKGKEKEGKKED